MTALAYHVPGVYHEPRPRDAEQAVARTDVAGFIGFEPRVRQGTTPSTLSGTAHSFLVDVAGFQLVVGGVRGVVEAVRDFPLSRSAVLPLPLAVGESRVYALAAGEKGGKLTLVAASAPAAASGGERSPDAAAIDAAVALDPRLGPGRPWVRIADVTVRREAPAVFLTVAPSLPLTRCDDWRDYRLALGDPEEDGTFLGPAVLAFFTNGGRRCWVATIRRPDFEDARELARAREDMVGIAGASEVEATGLERLLTVPEVTFADVPDLYARRLDRTVRTVPLPPSQREACFVPCAEVPPRGTAVSHDRQPPWRPIFESFPPYDGVLTNEVFETQKRLLQRAIPERWRLLLLLSVPLQPDGGSGPYLPPTDRDATAWRAQFHRLVTLEGFADTDEMAAAALYWPWILEQPEVDGHLFERPPAAAAAGVIARRDLARGSQVSPARETLRAVVGLTTSFGDEVHGRLYDPEPDATGFVPPAVNVLRPFPGYGIQVWGARTLSTETWLRFLAVRRTLTAIELRMKAALDLLVFEPNTPMLWLRVTQIAFSVLMPLFESGALRGERPEEAFYVRCDRSVNPPESVALGRLYVEVGVAVAAPAEFLVFRVGRREGVTEVLE